MDKTIKLLKLKKLASSSVYLFNLKGTKVFQKNFQLSRYYYTGMI